MPIPEYGQIIWATVYDPNGVNPKRRALVILTATEIRPGEQFAAAAISKSYRVRTEAFYVRLPFRPHTGHHRTLLRADCAVICDWLVKLTDADIQGYSGKASEHEMNEIIRKIDALNP